MLFIECSALKGKKANISLFNIIGHLVRNLELKEGYNALQQLDLDGLSEGMYMLRMMDEKGGFIKSKRIVISK